MKSYAELQPGDSAFFEKTISETDVYSFAGITGDFNSLHINEEYAKSTRFQRRIAHGMLTGSLFSTVFASKLPGQGSIYMSQELRFESPVYFGDTIRATVTVREKQERNHVLFECRAVNQDGQTVVSGSALLKVP